MCLNSPEVQTTILSTQAILSIQSGTRSPFMSDSIYAIRLRITASLKCTGVFSLPFFSTNNRFEFHELFNTIPAGCIKI